MRFNWDSFFRNPYLRNIIQNNQKLAITIGTYFGVVNLASVGIFYYDKQQAIQHKWRIPEKTLCLTGLMGGWPGGFLAMQQFKHKRSKPSFLQKYYVSVCLNILLLVTIAYAGRKYLKPMIMSPTHVVPLKSHKFNRPNMILENETKSSKK